ncbi:HdeD family acid-resistance protein [Bacteroides sp. 224]|uniref:HdeD family acid-resistance protein n=1 Tax=Bacteroides sp. 224 TaxID=2302936 RepID=UPI00351BCCA3
MNYSFIRAICALIIGLVLVIWPDLAVVYLVITIGILFLVPGLFGVISYFANKSNQTSRNFPIASIGSVLLGLILVIVPALFVDILMILLGIVLLLGGIQQLYSLFTARKWTAVPVGFYVLPLLITIAGVFILFNPTDARNTAFIIIGASGIVYAISELINWFRFINKKPKTPVTTDIVDAEIIDE